MAVRNFAQHFEPQDVGCRASSSAHDLTVRYRHGRLFTRDERVIDARGAAQQLRIGGSHFSWADFNAVAGVQLFQRDELAACRAFDTYGQRKEGPERAIKPNSVEHLVLEEPPKEKKEDEPGKRVEKSLAVTARDVDDTAHEQDDESE